MRFLTTSASGVPRLLTSLARLHDSAGGARMRLGDRAFSRRLVDYELRRSRV